MNWLEPIQLPTFGEPISPGGQYFAHNGSCAPGTSTHSSALLDSVRKALRGSRRWKGKDKHESVRQASDDWYSGEERLSWDDHTVIWSVGGVQRKKWHFGDEGRPVQYACLGTILTRSQQWTGSSNTFKDKSPPSAPDEEKEPTDTFSPFFKSRGAKVKRESNMRLHHAVFVFLRTFAKILLLNGEDYTFPLPFIVRRAWPARPIGVFVQRTLDEEDMQEENPLPSLFSITNPYLEPRAVGLTEEIKGTDQQRLKEDEDGWKGPYQRVSAHEHVIAAHTFSFAWIIITVNVPEATVTIWRYAFTRPDNKPQSAPSADTKLTIAQMLMDQPGIRNPDRNRPPTPDILNADLPEEFAETPSTPGGQLTDKDLLREAELLIRGSEHSFSKERRSSITRNDLMSTMDRITGRKQVNQQGRSASPAPLFEGDDNIRSDYWMQPLHKLPLPPAEQEAYDDISTALFDSRFDGTTERALLALVFPVSKQMHTFAINLQSDATLTVVPQGSVPAVSAVSLRATRSTIPDLLYVTPEGGLKLYAYGLQLCDIYPQRGDTTSNVTADISMGDADGDRTMHSYTEPKIIRVEDPANSSVKIVYEDGKSLRMSTYLIPEYEVVTKVLEGLSVVLTSEEFLTVAMKFLSTWVKTGRSSDKVVQYECLESTILHQLGLSNEGRRDDIATSSWDKLSKSSSQFRLHDDTALLGLDVPPEGLRHRIIPPTSPCNLRLTRLVLYVLHNVAGEMRVLVHMRQDLFRLAPLLCKVAQSIRPELVDYWKRVFPTCADSWLSLAAATEEVNVESFYAIHDLLSSLFARIAFPERPAESWEFKPPGPVSYAFDKVDLFKFQRELESCFAPLSDLETTNDTRTRAIEAIARMVELKFDTEFLKQLPLAMSMPLREAARTCQVSPPPDWPLAAYRLVGRDELAESAIDESEPLSKDGYRTVKDHLSQKGNRKSYHSISEEAHTKVHHADDISTGVEMDEDGFLRIRFGHDQRLREVGRLLMSSRVTNVKMPGGPDYNEHELAKEQQAHVLRCGERTLALPIGRAMFTFASLTTITTELLTAPKINLTVRLFPFNTVVTPDPGKIPPDSLNWAEFHNGVASALRISPSATGIDSSWISFNKPPEMTNEHAGFLYGLGLTGHLKCLVTWHVFSYLTLKHDLLSIGFLLGLCASYVGTGHHDVARVLAVHVPALLPTQDADLNVSLLTQAAGLVGAGLLFMGTKNRRIAVTMLEQMKRKELLQPDLSNEHREAYTIASALAFGMIMVGRGEKTDSPADDRVIYRIRLLIHGEPPTNNEGQPKKKTFDVNITSPAASMALAMMYLRTNRKDIADILTIPSTVLELNHIQPNFLLVRTIGRALIMWDNIKPTIEWIERQVPEAILVAVATARLQRRPLEGSIELAYHHIISGACFALGLKYAGTARDEVYKTIIRFYDMFSRPPQPGENGVGFDFKIRRAALRDGLNLIAISLNMVMAGTGEVSCLKRLRFAHGMLGSPVRYGSHMATHMSIGLLFLGGGRYTLGNTNSAIACMIAAFYPCFPVVSADNKSYLQALRHLWVLAAEPRCLLTRDVDTKEVVYMPIKIRVKELGEEASMQLISPTLFPGLDRLLSIKVDTPRYWPTYLDVAKNERHREMLILKQTIYVKRRTMFLSYYEDPKGSRSMFVRSGTSTAEAATLDNPQLADTSHLPAADLKQFITSYSNDVLFSAFSDRFCSDKGETKDENTLAAFCHAAILDCIALDKPSMLPVYLQVYQTRIIDPRSRYYQLIQHDMRLTASFYYKIYERRFSGRMEGISRLPLIRENSILGPLRYIDEQHKAIRNTPEFRRVFGAYAIGDTEAVNERNNGALVDLPTERALAWYLLRHSVPCVSHLVALRELARESFEQLAMQPPPTGVYGTDKGSSLEEAIKLVLHGTGSTLVKPTGHWTLQSLEDIMRAWQQPWVE